MEIADSYAIQRAWMALKREQGRSSIGRKIGLTSRAMQRAVNITEPDYGVLLDDMLFPDGREVPFDRFIEPRVEVELAFILKRRFEGVVTIFDVLNATD
jgi:2-oxo-hept-3-ene-1,7-dioate hydratase